MIYTHLYQFSPDRYPKREKEAKEYFSIMSKKPRKTKMQPYYNDYKDKGIHSNLDKRQFLFKITGSAWK